MRLCLITALAGLVLGLGLGKYLFDKKPPQETFAQAIKQTDGSLVLERNPYEKPKKILMPTGAELFRQANFIVSTKTDKLNLSVSLVKMPDDTLRTIVKTDKGEVIGGTDVPIDMLHRPVDYTWNAGFILGDQLKGIYVQKFYKRFNFGLDLYQHFDNFHKQLGYNVRIGYSF